MSRPADSLEIDMPALNIHSDELHANPVAGIGAPESMHQRPFNWDSGKPDPCALVSRP
jgi:hypothetical protein